MNETENVVHCPLLQSYSGLLQYWLSILSVFLFNPTFLPSGKEHLLSFIGLHIQRINWPQLIKIKQWKMTN